MSEDAAGVPVRVIGMAMGSVDAVRLLERLPVSVAELDAVGVVVSANAALGSVLGAAVDELIGLDLGLFRWHESAMASAGVGSVPGVSPVDRLLAGEPVDGLLAVTGLDGRRREVRVRAVPASGEAPALLVMADVTEQLHRVQTQSAYTGIHRTVAEYLADMVLVTEQDVIVWASPSVEVVLGRTSAELLGCQIETLVHPQDRVGLQVTPSAPTMATHGRMLRADGTSHWVDGRVTAQYGPDGTVERVLHVFRDVHAQHLAEDRATSAMLLQRAALDASPDGFAIYHAQRDPVGQVSGLVLEFLNAAGTASYPGRASDAVGTSILDFYPQAASNGLWQDMITTLATGQTHTRRLVDDLPAGQMINDVLTGRLDEDTVVVTYRDVTEQARQQDQLEQAHRELAQAQDTVRSALDATPEAFAICDIVRGCHGEPADLRVVMANRAGADRVGLTQDEVAGALLSDLLGHRSQDTLDQALACLNDQQPRRRRQENGTFGEPDWDVNELLLTPVGHDRITMALRDVTEDARARRAAEQLRAQAEHQATHDPLTLLPNRALFMDRLARALQECRAGERVGVLYVDLDGFKQVNDTHGHAAGDAVLQAIAQRLAAAIRPYDTAARLGGDEFAVILRHLPAALNIAPLVERTGQRLARPIPGPDGPLTVSASIGLYVADPLATEQDQDPATALDQADQAMYEAKKHQPDPRTPPSRRHEDTPVQAPTTTNVPETAPDAQERGPHHQETPLGPTCGAEDLARCRALAHHARPERDLFRHPVCRRTGPLDNESINTLLERIDALAEQTRNWSPEAWDLLAGAAVETPELLAARKLARECAHNAGRDALLAYARSVIDAIANPATPSNPHGMNRTAAVDLVHDALLAALAADLISDEISQTLRHGLAGFWFV